MEDTAAVRRGYAVEYELGLSGLRQVSCYIHLVQIPAAGPDGGR